MKVKSECEVAQSCPTLHDPMDCSPPGSSIHGIFQARILEWGAIAFSDPLSSKRKRERQTEKKEKKWMYMHLIVLIISHELIYSTKITHSMCKPQINITLKSMDLSFISTNIYAGIIDYLLINRYVLRI